MCYQSIPFQASPKTSVTVVSRRSPACIREIAGSVLDGANEKWFLPHSRTQKANIRSKAVRAALHPRSDGELRGGECNRYARNEVYNPPEA